MSEVTTEQSQVKTKRKGKGFSLGVLLLFLAMIGIIAHHMPPMGPYVRRGYDAEVKKTLWIAAEGQEAYLKDNETFTNKIGSLKGFNQSTNVNLKLEATTTTYVITGATIEGCSPNTGVWSLSSTEGSISGTLCE